MVFNLVVILLLLIVAILMIKGKELKINITMHHKYDAPQPPEQLTVEKETEKETVLGVVEALNKYWNGEE